MSLLSRIIRWNNWLTRRRGVRVPPGNLLLLAPRCLQNSACKRPVTDGLAACARCGRCDVSALVGLCKQFGIRGRLAGGGRQAIGDVRRPDVRAVVAIACEQELWDGIRAAFPKPVYAVCNRRPRGPCRDTAVDVAEVRAAIEAMLIEPLSGEPPERPAGAWRGGEG